MTWNGKFPDKLTSRIEKLNYIQDMAIHEASLNNWIGTFCVATGVGKTFMSFKYLMALEAHGKLTTADTVWFLAETTTRHATLIEEADKFESIYKVNPLDRFNIEFHCYQGKPDGKPLVIIADEVHMALTPKYQECFKQGHKFILGLSATIPKNLQVYRDDEDNDLTKGQLLDTIAPIIFDYPLSQAITDGILSPYRTTVIKHSLDYKDKYIPSGTKKKPFMATERRAYDYNNSIVKSFWAQPPYKGLCAKRMCRMLWNLKSKADVIKKLLPTLEGKTIIFGVELALLEKITPNVVRGGSKKQEKINEKLIDDFNSGKINVIASSKKLKQGITLEGVTNCIIVSYYKQSWSMIQQLGRIVRFVEGKLANLYIVRTDGTYEESWFENMNKLHDEKGKIIDEIDLNVTEYLLSENILLYDT